MVASFKFTDKDLGRLAMAGARAQQREAEGGRPLPMRIVTKEKMRVFELVTGNGQEDINAPDETDGNPAVVCSVGADGLVTCNDKLRQFNDNFTAYSAIAMPEVGRIKEVLLFADWTKNSKQISRIFG